MFVNVFSLSYNCQACDKNSLFCQINCIKSKNLKYYQFWFFFQISEEILKNGVVQNVDLSSGSVDWSQVTVKKTTDNKNISTWKMIFSEGLTAGVQLTNGMFQLVIDAGGSYRGNLEGDL